MTSARNILFVLLAVSACSNAQGDTLRLRKYTTVEAETIHLRDIADMNGRRAEDLSDIVVKSFDGQTSVCVKLHDIRQLLTNQNVNWAMLSLTGYNTCTVERITPQPKQIVQTPEIAIPTVTNPTQAIDLTSAVTLRQRAEQFIRDNAGADDLVITFADGDADALDQPALDGRYEFEPVSAGLIGRVPLIVRQWQGDVIANQYRITADVARKQLAVVAVRSLRRGGTVQRGDVEIRDVLVRDSRTQPLTSLDGVIGKTVSGYIRENVILTDDNLQSPLLIQRGELMQVRCVRGAVVIKLKARASEDGALGQFIAVRPEGRRSEIIVRVTGRGQGINAIASETPTPSTDSGFDFNTGRTAVR